MKSKDVFVAGGMPGVTYIGRDELKLEEKLKAEISEGYKVVCITGPTKSGKTVLCRRVLENQEAVWVQGGHVEESIDFWNELLANLGLPEAESQQSNSSISASFSALIGLKATLAEGKGQQFPKQSKTTMLRYMRENDIALVVDDFHYMPDSVQKEIIRTMKSEIFDGLTALFIAVPHHAFDTISVETEMQGRFSNVNIPEWKLEELKRIAQLGFPALNIDVEQSIIDNFSREALGSPLLMQRFCGRLCIRSNYTERQKKKAHVDLKKDEVSSIYVEVANQAGFPTYDKLAKGPQNRSKRSERSLKSEGDPVDLYQALLLAVSKTGPKDQLHYNEIRDSLKTVLEDEFMPAKHEVSRTLGKMSDIARDEIDGEPAIEWVDDHLYITDPFLMFFMRWEKARTLPD